MVDIKNPVTQRRFDENGIGLDCWKCCIATILGVDYEEVPQLLGKGTAMSQQRETEEWLTTLGLHLETGTINLLSEIPEGELFIGSGLSPRTVDGLKFHHAVVCALDERKMVRVVHDPHPSRKGLVGDPDYFYRIVKQPEEPVREIKT